MVKTNLISIFRKFDPKEIKEFSEFIRSPFFNKNFNVIRLYEYIKKLYPDFNEEKLEKKYVYKRLFGKGAYNDGFMRTVIFNLGQLAEEYLKYLNFKKTPAKGDVCLLDELSIRKIDKVFLKNYDEVKKQLDCSKYKTDEFYFFKSELDKLLEDFVYITRYKNKNLEDFTVEIFKDVVDHLTHFYLIRILRHYRFLLAKQVFISVDVDFGLVELIIDYLKNKQPSYINDPVIKLHLNEILLLKESKEEYYNELKKLLIDGQSLLDVDQRYSLHNILHIYCNKQTYLGNRDFVKERFDLYKIALKQGIYKGSEDRYFDGILFGNVLLTALKIGEIDWAEGFVENYSNELSPENREGFVNYALSRIKFSKGEFNQSLQILNRIKSFNYIQYKIAIRDLMMLNYYELSLFSQAYSFLDSHRHFLNKNKNYFSGERYEREANFMKFYTRALKLKERFNTEEFKELDKDVQKVTGIIERDWLLKKIDDFRNDPKFISQWR
ncbi:MAG TPA: hypothetical protein VGK25_12390 [Ignavibacteria bacterium]|jgi:hypothetical protein